MNTRLALIGLISLIPFAAVAANDDLVGAYNLISGTRKLLDTGEVVDAFGKNPKGSIIYSKEGRFLVMITWDGRPKPESIEKTTDQQAAELYRTMAAYGGAYDFDGKKVEQRGHHRLGKGSFAMIVGAARCTLHRAASPAMLQAGLWKPVQTAMNAISAKRHAKGAGLDPAPVSSVSASVVSGSGD